jgi:hypothetical protein
MSNTGLGQKMVEVGVSAAKATTDEIKNTISTAASQISGSTTPQKSQQELQQLESADKTQSTARIDQIKKELATQRFHEVNNLNASLAPQQKQEASGPEIPNSRYVSNMPTDTRHSKEPESVWQAKRKTEQGKNFKG